MRNWTSRNHPLCSGALLILDLQLRSSSQLNSNRSAELFGNENVAVLYVDDMVNTMASQITIFTSVYSTVYSGTDERKLQSSSSLAFVRGIHRWPLNSLYKGPVTRKTSPFDDVIVKRCLQRCGTNSMVATFPNRWHFVSPPSIDLLTKSCNKRFCVCVCACVCAWLVVVVHSLEL